MSVLLHLHLLSDSTGETLDAVAKAAAAQFEGLDTVKHTWPMVRSEGHLERVLAEISRRPGPIIYTLVNSEVRRSLERLCRQAGLPHVAALDGVVAELERLSGLQATARPGRQHALDAAYFARVDAIQFTIAHDDGVAPEDWDEADLVLVGVSRSSKTPTSIYLANRGYKVANLPLVLEATPPPELFGLTRPLVVGLTTSVPRLLEIRRNRLRLLNESESNYVDEEMVSRELATARRLFADRGWPVIDVTRRSIEETAASIIKLLDTKSEGETWP